MQENQAMKTREKEKNEDIFLDITNEMCPMTFVRTKLLLEKMSPGEIALIRLRGEEPLKNVPRSVTDHGHTILSLEPEKPGHDVPGAYLLRIKRT